MPLIDQVQKDMVAAMKARQEARLSALRMIKAALMKQKVDSPKPLDEAAEMQVLKSLIKQRIDAAEAFRKAGRAEQADKEEAERALIESYLPAAATATEDGRRRCRRAGRNRSHLPQADGRGDEGGASQARRARRSTAKR